MGSRLSSVYGASAGGTGTADQTDAAHDLLDRAGLHAAPLSGPLNIGSVVMLRLLLLFTVTRAVFATGSDGCWWTGCQKNDWLVQGCQQYGRTQAAVRDCHNGHEFQCCPSTGGASGDTCWWTGCQKNDWAVRGCAQYNRIQQSLRYCDNGEEYFCCPNWGGGSSSGGSGGRGEVCWWTGCQKNDWAVRGCQQYNRVQSNVRNCVNGNEYYCCPSAAYGGGNSIQGSGSTGSSGAGGTGSGSYSNGGGGSGGYSGGSGTSSGNSGGQQYSGGSGSSAGAGYDQIYSSGGGRPFSGYNGGGGTNSGGYAPAYSNGGSASNGYTHTYSNGGGRPSSGYNGGGSTNSGGYSPAYSNGGSNPIYSSGSGRPSSGYNGGGGANSGGYAPNYSNGGSYPNGYSSYATSSSSSSSNSYSGGSETNNGGSTGDGGTSSGSSGSSGGSGAQQTGGKKCWWTGCQRDDWKARGCAQYNMLQVNSKPCPAGQLFHCCQKTEGPNTQVVIPGPDDSCWWTGCQKNTWAVRGCANYNRIQTNVRYCDNGQEYYCCPPQGGNQIQAIQETCWWTGCQKHDWKVRGCDNYNRIQKNVRQCYNGDEFYCCPKQNW